MNNPEFSGQLNPEYILVFPVGVLVMRP